MTVLTHIIHEKHKKAGVSHDSCHTVTMLAAGLSPEYVVFNKLWGMRSGVHVYLMRPEAVEAFFVLWRLTGNTKYREYGWGFFQAIEKWCKVKPSAHAGFLMA